MRTQIIAIIVSLLVCATFLVSAKPAASVGEQHRAISFPNIFQLQNPFCASMLCFAPCNCGSHLDSRGCSTCSCLPCDGAWW
ncbi:unnamed protein product [Adineta steineri]|uniref:Uncharacterized protein n=1 Tax=Adineta steineri TaxID=433720 RepID=A0A813MUZ2_9BILA|nr:unnamed protein product [Adineta steineri]CAF0794833.1 unnamed protein product [Adineta steineri]